MCVFPGRCRSRLRVRLFGDHPLASFLFSVRAEGVRARVEARDLGRELATAKERIAALERANSALQKHLQQLKQQQQNQPQQPEPEPEQQQQQHRRLSREEVEAIMERQKQRARERAPAAHVQSLQAKAILRRSARSWHQSRTRTKVA